MSLGNLELAFLSFAHFPFELLLFFLYSNMHVSVSVGPRAYPSLDDPESNPCRERIDSDRHSDTNHASVAILVERGRVIGKEGRRDTCRLRTCMTVKERNEMRRHGSDEEDKVPQTASNMEEVYRLGQPRKPPQTPQRQSTARALSILGM